MLCGPSVDSLKAIALDPRRCTCFLPGKVPAPSAVVNVQSSVALEAVRGTTALALDHLGAVRGA